MKSALASVTFNAKSIEEVITLVKKAELSAIEWGGKTHVKAGDTDAAKKAYALSRENGIPISGYGAYYYGMPGEDFAPTLENALILEAPVVRIWAGKGFGPSENCPEDLRKQITENLQVAAEKAKKQGITVATEYHLSTLTDNIDSTLRLLAEAPDLCTYWQPRHHPVQTIEKEVADIKALGKRLVNVHAFANIDFVRYPLDTWSEKWVSCIAALRAHTKAGYAAIEFVKDDTEQQFFADAKTLNALLYTN